MEINNRKARYEYEIIDTYETGIVLTGTEIKSIRNGNANLKDSYGIIKNNEIYLLNMHISSYEQGNQFNHKKEILKIRDKINIEGYTLIPLKLYFSKNYAKILLGVAKGKKMYDKRESIKEKDIKRDLQKQYKGFN